MDNDSMIEKNQELQTEIIGMGYEGEGIAKIDKFPIFVEGAMPGEIVDIKIVKLNKNYAFGKLLKIIKPSSDRNNPICSTYKYCGGCNLQHISYEAQLSFKKQRVEECISKIGKLQDITVHDVIGMKEPYFYRNKVQLPIGMDKDKVKIGFYAPRSHDIINIEKCYIQDEISDEVIKNIRYWIEKYNIKPYDENSNSGIVRHIVIRKAFKTGEVMVILVTNSEKISFIDEFIELITKNVAGIKSIIQNINTKKSNVILGEKCITLWGSNTITDYIEDFKFYISPLSFFQVNPIQTEILYDKALEYANLSGDETVFDAYCGTGTISLFLSKKAKKVYGVEIVPEAIENAKENAKINNVENAEFLVGEAERIIPDLINKSIKADIVVVDPPRKGCEKLLLESIAAMKPNRIVYVSCDPATLARDLSILNDLGYKTIEIQPVDMFPMTAHVECVCLLKKNM